MRSLVPSNPYDVATCLLLAAIAVVALFTFRDYAISNDEGVQHHYGELIIAYYRSGFRRSRSLHLPEPLSLWRPVRRDRGRRSPRSFRSILTTLRHILCAMTGIGGIAAAAATARLVAGPRAGLIAAVALEPVRRLVRRDVQPHQGHSLCRRDDGGDASSSSVWRARSRRRAGATSRPSACSPGQRLACAASACCCSSISRLAIVIHLPWWEGRGARLRFAADCGVEDLSGGGAGLSHHDRGLALGRAVAAQPDPRIVCLLRISLCHPHRVRGTHLRDGRGAAALCARLSPDPRAADHADRVALAIVSMLALPLAWTQRRRDLALLLVAAILPLACQVALHGPAFTGMRHFLFVLPALATLAGIGFDAVLDRLATQDAG